MQGIKFSEVTVRVCRLDGIPDPVGYSVVGTYNTVSNYYEYVLADLDGGFPVLYSDRDQASVVANNNTGEVVDLEDWILINIGENGD